LYQNLIGTASYTTVEIKGFGKGYKYYTTELEKNQITEIKGLDTLINLQVLDLERNQITEIKNLDRCVSCNPCIDKKRYFPGTKIKLRFNYTYLNGGL
jgi:Leucine-rich repeat (LRR) protein